MTLDGKHIRQVWRVVEGTTETYTSRVLVLQYWRPDFDGSTGFWVDVPMAEEWDETEPKS